MRSYKLYLLRHGMVRDNLEGRYVGSQDPDLCEEGVAQLVELRDKYEYPGVGRVYSSPMKRCVETARLLYPEQTPVTVSELRDCGLGKFEGHTVEELRSDPTFRKWMEDAAVTTPEGGETLADFRDRIVSGLDAVIRDIMRDGVSEAVLITHGGVISTLLAECGMPRRSVAEWPVDSGCGYTLQIGAYLWSTSRLVEVFTPVPYGWNQESVMLDYQRGLPEAD